ncbi:hypothetical protein DPMN_151242 [Dreissena polymorpha]|uniref:Uncharacterized protein n=1 Tax=Dreissena polymorpha TaxID=45954 RepID=A0A9D4J6S0_DREPO|nr:hypothetical protein DPMN_151242 [Dreissena polymorpha]
MEYFYCLPISGSSSFAVGQCFDLEERLLPEEECPSGSHTADKVSSLTLQCLGTNKASFWENRA